MSLVLLLVLHLRRETHRNRCREERSLASGFYVPQGLGSTQPARRRFVCGLWVQGSGTARRITNRLARRMPRGRGPCSSQWLDGPRRHGLFWGKGKEWGGNSGMAARTRIDCNSSRLGGSLVFLERNGSPGAHRMSLLRSANGTGRGHLPAGAAVHHRLRGVLPAV